jgi:hypothetical protein
MVGATSVEEQTGSSSSSILDRMEPSDAGRGKTDDDTCPLKKSKAAEQLFVVLIKSVERVVESAEIFDCTLCLSLRSVF